jgi:hypothetical protein
MCVCLDLAKKKQDGGNGEENTGNGNTNNTGDRE